MEKGYKISVLDHGHVIYLGHYGSDQIIVDAARISYGGISKGEEADKKLLAYLWKNKHTSPFEMIKLHLQVKMPIFVMRQWVRHRMQNLNEVSARYSQLPNEFYVPTKWRKQDTKNKQGSEESKELPHDYFSLCLQESYAAAYKAYEAMLANGIAREMARIVLPVGIYTEIQCVWDMKNLLHFITLRDDSHAQAEIQEYSRAIKSICAKLFPWTMEAYNKYKFVLQENNT